MNFSCHRLHHFYGSASDSQTHTDGSRAGPRGALPRLCHVHPRLCHVHPRERNNHAFWCSGVGGGPVCSSEGAVSASVDCQAPAPELKTRGGVSPTAGGTGSRGRQGKGQVRPGRGAIRPPHPRAAWTRGLRPSPPRQEAGSYSPAPASEEGKRSRLHAMARPGTSGPAPVGCRTLSEHLLKISKTCSIIKSNAC